MFHSYYKYHNPRNLLKERNPRNADRREYNCAGYALGCFSWYCPFDFHFDDLEENVAQLLEDFPNLRKIASVDELAPDEYMIAFRVSPEDFHFMKRGKNGVWHEKRGSRPSIQVVPKSVVFGEAWAPEHKDGGYRSEIAFFAVKE